MSDDVCELLSNMLIAEGYKNVEIVRDNGVSYTNINGNKVIIRGEVIA